MRRRAPTDVVISVPWPIRLFGDFQDGVGLPSIVMACNLRTSVSAIPIPEEVYVVRMPGDSEPLRFDPWEDEEEFARAPALRRAFLALRRAGLLSRRGYDFDVHTRVPCIEELPDSPAMTVAWLVSLLAVHNKLKDMSGNEIADLIRQSLSPDDPLLSQIPEVYATVLGGMLFVRPAESPAPLPFSRELPGVILCHLPDSDAAGRDLLRQAARDIENCVSRMEAVSDEFSLKTMTLDSLMPMLHDAPEADAGLLYAHLMLRDFCALARELLEDEHGLDDDRIGELLDNSNEMLNDYVGFKASGTQALMEAARGAGASGCKVIPGTDGFVIFAAGQADAVLRTVKGAGGEARLAPVSDGMRIED